MKRFKLIITFLLIITLVFSAVSTAAANAIDDETDTDEVAILGDIDGDSNVNIIDGTALQLYLAELKELSDAAVSRGDADLDDATTITDVTHLQRFLANDDTRVFYLGMKIEAAKLAKLSDEETTAQNSLLQSQVQADEDLKNTAAAEKAARTTQAMKDYQVRLKEIEGLSRQIEESIKNYKQQKGVDISEFNGDVDFNKLKAAGYTFVMIRMGFGSNYSSQDDRLFEQNVKKAEAAGMPWGAYLYSYALDTSTAKSEVNHSLRLLKGKKPTMPIAFDMESDSYKYNNGMPSDKMLHDICVTYLNGIRSAGYYPILYSGYYWLTGALNSKDLTGTYDIWLAQWSSKMDYNTDKVGMWQYGGETNFLESPYIDGLYGLFDKDFCFKNYPVIITAYGYNNHTAILEGNLAATGASPEDFETEGGKPVPEGYNDVMGNSFR